MSGIDHPPSTTSSSRRARRALATATAALGAVALVTSAAGGTEPRSAQADETTTSFLETHLVRAVSDTEGVRYAGLAGPAAPVIVPTTTTAAPTTTTTAPPPPPTTTTAPPPPPAPAKAQPATGGSGYADPANPAAWDRLAQCEAGGNWAINTGNGYYGGLQFSLSSWQAVGGTGYPHEASRETQIAMGQRLHAQGGWGHWPGCSRQLGYR